MPHPLLHKKLLPVNRDRDVTPHMCSLRHYAQPLKCSGVRELSILSCNKVLDGDRCDKMCVHIITVLEPMIFCKPKKTYVMAECFERKERYAAPDP